MPGTCPARKKDGYICGNSSKFGKFCGVHKDRYYLRAYDIKRKELSSQAKSLLKIAQSVKKNEQRIVQHEHNWGNLSATVKNLQKEQKTTNTTLCHVQTGLAALALEQQKHSLIINNGMTALERIERKMVKDKPTKEDYLNKRIELLHDTNTKRRENNLAVIRGMA